MPRGKLHYEQSWDEIGNMIETWKDSHGREYMEVTSFDNFEEGDPVEFYDDEYSDPYDD